ncbi:MAG TPA: hypothetical protein VGQ99_16035 [Tepidisphaeraceae bacterium]|nr:hypothetical protein [Tepidisphaeraceae bacterium]
MVAFKAHFDGKVIIPDEPLNLPVNQRLIVRVESADAANEDGDESVFDWILKNPIDDPSLPTDLSENLDHYLYGTPKKKP